MQAILLKTECGDQLGQAVSLQIDSAVAASTQPSAPISQSKITTLLDHVYVDTAGKQTLFLQQ